MAQQTMSRLDEQRGPAYEAGKHVLCYTADTYPDWAEASHEQCEGLYYDHTAPTPDGEAPPRACGCVCHLTRLPLRSVAIGSIDVKAGKTGAVLRITLHAPLDNPAADDVLSHAQAILTERVNVEITLRQLPLPLGLSGRENGTAREG